LTPFTATFTVEKYLHGSRVDTFLERQLRNYTIWRMQRMVSAGCVRVQDVVVSLDRRVFGGERVTIRLIEPPDKIHGAEPMPLSIVFEDPWLVVVDKPANLVVHPVASLQTGTLANGLQAHLDSQTPVTGVLRPGIVHRLDRMTSGLIVTTKDHLAHRNLGMDFEQRRVRKAYTAVVHGVIDDDQGTIDLPMGRRHGSILMSVEPGMRNMKPAITNYKVTQRLPDRTVVEVRPVTGRIHQIRVHFAAIGHPLVGDEFYGFDGPVSRKPGDSRHALHASYLSLTHPVLGEAMEFHSSLPPDLEALLSQKNQSLPTPEATT
jgi:23S rRNA pseudouridine1911/1915/1917 synthase